LRHDAVSGLRAGLLMKALRTDDAGTSEHLPDVVPNINLHRGEVVWVLAQLGFQGTATLDTFREYIKSLRKLGIPFSPGEIGYAERSMANYGYKHLMELGLVLTLRVYHAVPDSLLAHIIRYRRSLRRHYVSAVANRNSGLGRPITIKAAGHKPIDVCGVFLDLRVNFAGAKLISFGPPKLLSPVDAMAVFIERDVAARSLLPINLSRLAERVIMLSLSAPVIRRGPHQAPTGLIVKSD
jgi:hypothetical protein